MYDVAIIGAGVVGCAVARQLSRYDLKIALMDAAHDVAMGASRANSAIVHAGYDCKPGTLMAKMNVRGNELYTKWCDELDVPLKRCGSLVLAFSEEEVKELKKLYDFGIKNGVPGMAIIDREEILKREPAVNPVVVAALWAETAGITCPYELTIACSENARANGAQIILDFKVNAIEKGDHFTVKSEDGRSVEAKYIINAAGLYSDDIAKMVGDDSFDVTPRQGEYMLLDKAAGAIVSTVIFQTPTKMGKGILVSPTVDGNIFAGPTARDTSDKTDTSTTPEGIAQLNTLSRKSVPELQLGKVITSFTGIRATPSTGDFIIGVSKADDHFINCAGICSPGLTSAPAIAEYVDEILRGLGVELNERYEYIANRSHIKRFVNMTEDEKKAAIENNPLYGRVICRCETITEAEIVEAIRRGANTLDGVKRRCRAGMGRCQGGFCAPRVMEILSRETGTPMEELTKFGGKSKLLTGRIKEGC